MSKQMSQLPILRYKYCACCSVRLDKVIKRDVRRVNENDLVTKLNTVKPIILTNKRKLMDSTLINKGDLICGVCRNFAKRFKCDNTSNVNVSLPSTTNMYPSLLSLNSPDNSSTSHSTLPIASTSTATTSLPSSSHASSANTRSSRLYPLSPGSSSDESDSGEVTLKIPRSMRANKNCIICNKS